MTSLLLVHALAVTQTVSTPVTFVASDIGTNNSVQVPMATLPGDLLIVAATADNGQLGVWSWPQGFHVLRAVSVDTPDGQSWVVGYRQAIAGETTLEVRNSASTVMVAVLVYRDADSVDPVGRVEEVHSHDSFGTTGPWQLTYPDIGGMNANARAVWISGTDLKLGVNVPAYDGGAMTPTTYLPPAGFTLRQEGTLIYNSLGIGDGPTGLVGLTSQASVGYVDVGNTVAFALGLVPHLDAHPVDFVQYKETSSVGVVGGGSVTLTAPTRLSAGDLMLLFVMYEEVSLGAVTWPPGFTQLTQVGTASTPMSLVVAAKNATGAESALPLNIATTTSSLVVLQTWNQCTVDSLSTIIGTLGISPWDLSTTATPAPSLARVVEVSAMALAGRGLVAVTPAPGFDERHEQSFDRMSIALADGTSIGGGFVQADADQTLASQPVSLRLVLVPGVSSVDGGTPDGGMAPGDAGLDAGAADGGVPDAGADDAGMGDAGANDAGAGGGVDAGGAADVDAGVAGRSRLVVGCGCSNVEGGVVLVLVIVSARQRRRHRQTAAD